MAYVIGPACLDEMDGSCVDACPVDCIYEGARKRYINPVECIECGACLPVCPVKAITTGRGGGEPEWAEDWTTDNERFFLDVLPGRTQPLGAPGGASGLGTIDADTELAARTPAQAKHPADE